MRVNNSSFFLVYLFAQEGTYSPIFGMRTSCEVHVIIDPKKTKAKRDELAKEHDLEGKQYTEGHNKECKDCRQSDLDEDEIHLHKVNVE